MPSIRSNVAWVSKWVRGSVQVRGAGNTAVVFGHLVELETIVRITQPLRALCLRQRRRRTNHRRRCQHLSLLRRRRLRSWFRRRSCCGCGLGRRFYLLCHLLRRLLLLLIGTADLILWVRLEGQIVPLLVGLWGTGGACFRQVFSCSRSGVYDFSCDNDRSSPTHYCPAHLAARLIHLLLRVA